MYMVHYTRSYATNKSIAFYKNYECAMERASEEYDMYSRDVLVRDSAGRIVYSVKEELLVDEL